MRHWRLQSHILPYAEGLMFLNMAPHTQSHAQLISTVVPSRVCET